MTHHEDAAARLPIGGPLFNVGTAIASTRPGLGYELD